MPNRVVFLCTGPLLFMMEIMGSFYRYVGLSLSCVKSLLVDIEIMDHFIAIEIILFIRGSLLLIIEITGSSLRHVGLYPSCMRSLSLTVEIVRSSHYHVGLYPSCVRHLFFYPGDLRIHLIACGIPSSVCKIFSTSALIICKTFVE